MIVVIYGTTGELIKLMPLLKTAPKDKIITICTYQQPQQLARLFKAADIARPDIAIGQSSDAQDLEKLSRVPWWFTKVWTGFFKHRRAIKRQLADSEDSQHAVVIHGDTTTTLLGSRMGRLLRLPVAHVEAGLRSFNWRHPFPEELNRIFVSKVARIHFAPGADPVRNLKKAGIKGRIINTRYNTVLDSLRLAQGSKTPMPFTVPKKYCLISIHRNELLAQPKELEKILGRIKDFAQDIPIIFLDHPITKERMTALGIDDLLKHKNIQRVPKQNYYRFIQLLAKSTCVITDSGGLQEESAYLGIPCLVHRRATERQEGLGENVVLSLYDDAKVVDFCQHYTRYKRAGVAKSISPTNKIIATLQADGFL